MADDSGQEKTETATQKKREDARKKGQICSSREIPAAAMLLLAVGFFYFYAPYMVRNLLAMIEHVFRESATMEAGKQMIPSLAATVGVRFALLLAPWFGVAVVVAVFSNVAQFGFNFAPEALAPKTEKLNFVTGFGKLFKINKLVELVKNLAKVGVVGYVAYSAIAAEWETFVPIMLLDPVSIAGFMGLLTLKIAARVVVVMIALAALDYVWQRHEYEKNLKMTKQEVKDEFKQREGDPMVKGRIRRLQMEMARRRMMEAVPTADVVITNPTHIAVAIKYESVVSAAPIVVAKGKGLVAQKIREKAEEAGVMILERKPLARALYKMVEIGGMIPEDLYQAVAEVLAYVYKLKRKAV